MATFEAKSEVTGSVWKILTAVGQRIQAGDSLVIIESMKMEIPVIAEEDGTIVEFRIEEGKPVVDYGERLFHSQGFARSLTPEERNMRPDFNFAPG